MSKHFAFGAELEVVEVIAGIIKANRECEPADIAEAIIEELNRPRPLGSFDRRIADALLLTTWHEAGNMGQNLRSLLAYAAAQGILKADLEKIVGRMVRAVLTEVMCPSVAMVDAGQAEIASGAKNFMRIWMKAFERSKV